MGGGEVVACNMARVLKDEGYQVIFACSKIVSTQEIKNKLGIDLSDITFKEISNEQGFTQTAVDLFINISFMDYTYGFAKKNIYYVHFPSVIRSGLFNYVLLFFQKTNLHFLLPNALKERINDRLRAGIYPDMKKRLNSYDTFITHSKYVKKWVKKLWLKDAQVLYPPVSLIDAKTEAVKEPSDSEGGGTASVNGVIIKHNLITSIGRFFTLGHGKKQEVLIEAFKRLTEAVKEPSDSEGGGTASVNEQWQLHLIGGVGSEPSSIRFVEKLKQMAQGYPIYFHFNASRSEVEEILLKSKIYWHASGYGEDAERDPIKFEHFGIAPIEAISAGCIPILFNGGGLAEIIELLGFDEGLNLFSTIDDLVENTNHILMMSEKIEVNSKILNTNFSPLSFKEKFTKIINY